jgi:hypothetical protein
MRAVRGHYDGNVVVLDEPAPLDGEADVIVQFPETAPLAKPDFESLKRSWEESRQRLAGLGTAVSDELRRQRDEE